MTTTIHRSISRVFSAGIARLRSRFAAVALCVGILSFSLSPSAAAQADAAAGPDQRAFAAAMQRLARYPDDQETLRDAALSAVRLGDLKTAKLLADRSRGDPGWAIAVEAALAAHRGEAAAAVQGFLRAEASRSDLSAFAAERGLAYDLAGDQPSAQFYYAQAIRQGYGGDDLGAEATRRRALSLAIGGEFAEGERLLAPLLARQDRQAWRIRAFMLAIVGRQEEAAAVLEAILPPTLAASLMPYMVRIALLDRGDQAAAALLGLFPVAAMDLDAAAQVRPIEAPERRDPRRRPGGSDRADR